MNKKDHEDFLIDVANKVDKLITPSSKERFQNRIKDFCGKSDKCSQEILSYKKAAEADPRLRDKEAGPPKEGYVWQQTSSNSKEGYWGPPDTELPTDPWDWLLSPISLSLSRLDLDSKPAKMPSEDEKLMLDYVLLAVIHDGALTGYSDRRIYFRPLDAPDCDDCDVWAFNKWRELTKWSNTREYYNGHRIRAAINRALEHVQADIDARELAETEQKDTAAKTINIQNFKGILGDVQAENVQTGNHASIHKQTVTAEKKKGILRKLLKIIGTIVVGIIVTVVTDILYDFGLIKWIRTFVHNILTHR